MLKIEAPVREIGDQRQDDLLALADDDFFHVGKDLLAGH
jgi:hypothetical protein